MALVEAYFDESGTNEGEAILCLAGFVIDSEKAKEMDEKWVAMLSDYSLPYFHMVDCAHGVGVFKTLDKQARIAVQTRAIQIMREHIAKCFAVSVDRFVYNSVVPNNPALGSAYSLLAHSCLTNVQIWANRENFQGSVAYFFEAGHKSQSEANGIMNMIVSNPMLRQRHFYGSHTFAQKQQVPLLQAADIIAWLWHGDCNRRLYRSPRPIRADLRTLYAPRWEGDKFMAVAHLGADELRTVSRPVMLNEFPLTYPWRN